MCKVSNKSYIRFKVLARFVAPPKFLLGDRVSYVIKTVFIVRMIHGMHQQNVVVVVVVVRSQQGKNGKEASEETEGKSSRVHGRR